MILTSFADLDAIIVSQPMTIRFEDEGCQRRYMPDFSVRWSDGRFELVEVMYRTDLRSNWSILLPGFSVARDLACERGGRFRIAIGSDRSVALSAVWRLIAHVGLKVDLDAPIGFDTPVMLT